MSQPESEIEIRLLQPDDLPFVFNSWLKSFRSSTFAQAIDDKVYFSQQHKLIEHLLTKSVTLIATPKGAPTTILAYLVFEPDSKVIHYAFTKFHFRRVGLGRELLNKAHLDLNECRFTHLTKNPWMASKFIGLSYDPYSI